MISGRINVGSQETKINDEGRAFNSEWLSKHLVTNNQGVVYLDSQNTIAVLNFMFNAITQLNTTPTLMKFLVRLE